jgi:hypothetical protein
LADTVRLLDLRTAFLIAWPPEIAISPKKCALAGRRVSKVMLSMAVFTVKRFQASRGLQSYVSVQAETTRLAISL